MLLVTLCPTRTLGSVPRGQGLPVWVDVRPVDKQESPGPRQNSPDASEEEPTLWGHVCSLLVVCRVTLVSSGQVLRRPKLPGYKDINLL